MADQTDISQFITETASEEGDAQISQNVVETGAESGDAQIAQDIVEVGSAGSSAQISQAIWETAPSHATVIISQLTIELAAGDIIPPPPPEPSTGTFVFDEGGSVEWWIVPQLTDSGVELRDKTIKALRVTGKITSANAKVYTYGPIDPVVVSDLEDGTNSATGSVALTNTTNVAQSQRWQVNCPNAMLSTIRIAGTWDGASARDRIDEIEYEVAIQGVRR